jgi:hypothetical protein
MPPHMVFVCPFLTTAAQIRRLRISVPLVPCLLDNQRYYLPDDLPPASGEELRPMLRPRIAQVKALPRAPRAPSLRSLVKLALACDSAEQMGKKLKQRFDRQQRRRGVYARRDITARDLAELDRLIGQD